MELRADKVVGVFAHPDDEVFCGGGTLARWSAEGATATVVCATRGEAGQIRDAGVAVRRTLGAVREQELRSSCERLGVSDVRMLDHADGHLADVPLEHLADEVESILAEVEPDTVITFGEDGAYGHPDHIAIGNAAALAAERMARRPGGGPRLLRSHFPVQTVSLAQRLADWLMSMDGQFDGSTTYGRALTLFAEESTTMRFASDDVRIVWHPPGSMIVEQGEPATSLNLILSGEVDVVEEIDGTSHFKRRLGEGRFFGELGVSRRAPRSASVIAVGNVTCLVLSPNAPTKFAGRGDGARHSVASNEDESGFDLATGILTIDIASSLDAKLAALAAHRSQYPIDPQLFPRTMLLEMYGQEYFMCSEMPAS